MAQEYVQVQQNSSLIKKLNLTSQKYSNVKIKICFDVFTNNQNTTLLGKGELDPLFFSNRKHSEVKCRIERCKDINAYVLMGLDFDEVLHDSRRQQFYQENPKTLYT